MSTSQTTCEIADATDYVISKMAQDGRHLSVLKLQKLLYYVQAWRIAVTGQGLFKGRFQAWVHGPVNREVYDRFKDSHSLYATVGISDLRKAFDPDSLTPEQRTHIDEILEAYGSFTGTQLEEMTHGEEPWIHARGGLKDHERCEREIDESLMGDYYKSLLLKSSS